MSVNKRLSLLLLVNQKNELLMQHRDNIPRIDSPNKIGLFGGHIEPDESPEDAIVREIAEELDGYKLKNFKPYKEFDFIKHDGITTKCYVYIVHDPLFKIEEHKITEGQGALWVSEEDLEKLDFASSSKKIISDFFSKN